MKELYYLDEIRGKVCDAYFERIVVQMNNWRKFETRDLKEILIALKESSKKIMDSTNPISPTTKEHYGITIRLIQDVLAERLMKQ